MARLDRLLANLGYGSRREVNGDTDQWIVWCHLNDESATMAGLIPDCVEVVVAD